jgi:plasmid stabilization system protein ParE
VRVTFNELAERELNDAVQYFEHEQSGLGAAFLVEVRRCASGITEHPEAGSVVLGRIRRRLCQRFPYGLLYTVAGDEARILTVMNLRRRPGYWVGRK